MPLRSGKLDLSPVDPIFARVSALLVAASTALAGASPVVGPVRAQARGGALSLENAAIAGEWRIEGGTLRPHRFVNRLTGAVVDVAGAQLFQLVLAGGTFIRASD